MSEQIAETEEVEHPQVTRAPKLADLGEEHIAGADKMIDEESDSPISESDESETEPDTFPRDYVEKLRDQNARYRQKAQRTDELAHRLHMALVEATGRLADASDLPFDEAHLDDPDKLAAAIEALVTAKPHLGARRVTGNIGQGESGGNSTIDLAGILRSRA